MIFGTMCVALTAVYTLDDCFEHVGLQTRPKICAAAKYPRHPWPSMRAVCGAKLLKAHKNRYINQLVINRLCHL